MLNKKLKTPLIFSLILLMIPMLAAKADDQVTITVQMGNGDATITLNQGANGTITIVYNGVNILDQMTTRSEYNHLKQKLYTLMNSLDNVFQDVYAKLNFIAYVTGVNTNDNSTVALKLKSGNQTIAGFLTQIFTALDNQHSKLKMLRINLESLDSTTKTEINTIYAKIKENREYYEYQLSKTNETITALKQQMDHQYNTLKNYADQQTSVVNSRVNGLTLSFGALSAVNLFMLAILIWISRWKTRQLKPK